MMDFKSRRSPVLGTRGMVASSQPLASEVRPSHVPVQTSFGDVRHLKWFSAQRVIVILQAGMRILQQGGNAAGARHFAASLLSSAVPQERALIVLQISINGDHCGAHQLMSVEMLIMLWIC